MSVPTLSELQTIPTQQEILDQEVLPELVYRKVRVTDWLVGGVYRAMSYVVAKLREQDRIALAALAAAGFEDYAFGFSSVPGGIDVTRYAPLIAKQRYGLDQIEASYTLRSITLTNSSAAPYGPLNKGDMIISFPSKNRYVLDEAAVTIPALGSVTAQFRSEYTSDSVAGRVYNDASGSTIALVISTFPGVTATNPAPVFTPVSQVGSGVGLVTPTGTPPSSHSVAVRIDTTGSVAGSTVAWSTQFDAGAWAPQSGSSVVDLGGTGITVTLTDNGGSPAFAAGAFYYFQTPGSDVIQVGRDIETPQALGTRCRGLLPLLPSRMDAAGNLLPLSPTAAGYELLALSASTQVVVAFVSTDGTVNNKVIICIAGQGALLPGSVIAAVQTFFNSMTMLTDSPVVVSPVLRALTLADATVTVGRGLLATAQAAAQRALQIYFGGVDATEKLSVNGLVDHAYVCSLIRTAAGVVRFTDETLTINGVADNLQLPVTPGVLELPSWTQSIATALNWTET